MAIEFEIVDIWLGNFPSRARLEAYFHEVIDPDDDDVPISEFATAMHQPFYDHDFVEHRFHDSNQSPDGLLRPHSFAKSYLGNAVEAAARLGVLSGNTSVLVWGHSILHPISVITEEYSLNYIGRFECDPSVG